MPKKITLEKLAQMKKSGARKNQNKSGDIHREIRHLGVFMERVHDDVKLVAEQHGDIKKDIGAIKKSLDIHTEMIGNLGIELTIIKGDIEFIKSSIKQKIDVEEFSALERRVALLERRR